MSQPPKLTSLETLRVQLYNAWVTKRALGGFDAHAETIVLLLETNLSMVNRLIELENRLPDETRPPEF